MCVEFGSWDVLYADPCPDVQALYSLQNHCGVHKSANSGDADIIALYPLVGEILTNKILKYTGTFTVSFY